MTMNKIICVLGVMLSYLLILTMCQDDTQGSEFIIGIPNNHRSSNAIPINLTLYVTTLSTDAVTFHVENTNGDNLDSETVTKDNPAIINLDVSIYEVTSSQERDKGIRVYTENEGLISVLVANIKSASISQYLAYPVHVLQQPVSQYTYYSVFSDDVTSDASYTLLVGTADSTTVDITPTTVVMLLDDIQSNNPADVSVVPGVTHTITIHKLQTYIFFAATGNLSGTKIVSDKPLTVVSGDECALIPSDRSTCDALAVQLLPTSLWGTRFLLSTLRRRTATVYERYYQIIASESDTTITHNCGITRTEGFNETLSNDGDDIMLTPSRSTSCYVESDKPVFIVVLGPSDGSENGNIGDPAIAMVPHIDAFTDNDITFYVPEYTGIGHVWMNYISTSDSPTVMLNGVIEMLSWIAIRDASDNIRGYFAHRLMDSFQGRAHTVSADAPLTVTVYAWSPQGSGTPQGYAFATGVTHDLSVDCPARGTDTCKELLKNMACLIKKRRGDPLLGPCDNNIVRNADD